MLLLSAGFYIENHLLLHNKQAQGSGKLPLPAGDTHSFAPVALGDVALLAAHILTGEGPHGFNDQHRGQMMVFTGLFLPCGNIIREEALMCAVQVLCWFLETDLQLLRATP